jgi:serine/threonine-protein kinase
MSTVAAPERRRIGEYEVERELGRGAFGTVFRAFRRGRPEVPVALKVVRGQGNLDRMMLEPAVLSRLHHPCIVGLEDYFVQGEDLVLALEYVEGRDVRSLLEEGAAFRQSDVRELLFQLGSALAAAHRQHVVHRDIKPANILVQRTPEGGWRFVLTDFGIGQVREGIATRKQTGGTYLFMAPEQLRGRPGEQSDLWAVGVVAYRLLTGRMPFPGPGIKELTNQILYGAVIPPSQICKEPIDPELEKAVLHLLDKSLQERTASAEELLRELGHKGAADTLPERTRKEESGPVGRSLDQRLARGIRWRKVVLAICVILYLWPAKPVSGTLLLASMALFYLGQRSDPGRRRVGLTLASFAVLAGHLTLFYFFPSFDFTHPLLAGIGGCARVFLPVVACALFAGLRRLHREKLLLDLARDEGSGSYEYLDALRQSLDTRFEDVGLHLKYAEALFARGRVKEAAVEARILLRQDPYHFNGNLLLANAYFALGLDEECVEVCEQYLKVSGYCFEFSELREQARRRAAA